MTPLDRIADELARIAAALERPRPAANLSAAEVAALIGWDTPDKLHRRAGRAAIEAMPPDGWGFPPPITLNPLRWDPAAIEAWRDFRRPAHLRGGGVVITSGHKMGPFNIDRLLDARGKAVAGGNRKGKVA